MERNIRIAITGGIGSGKSTVARIIADFGYRTISLDDVYRELLRQEEFVRQICELLGVEPLIENGKIALDRKLVSKKLFGNELLLQKLNSFTHSRIIEAAFAEGDQSATKDGVVFYEVPLLFEGGYESLFDRVIVIMRNVKERIIWAAQRDGVTCEEIEARIKNQFDYEKTDLSLHIVIVNDGDEQSLNEKIRKVLSEL